MSAKKAKRLRREVYGDISLKIKRVYIGIWGGVIVNDPDSPRAKYQQAKKEE